MRTERVRLRHTEGLPLVTIREPTGKDEITVEGVDTAAATGLLGRLVSGGGCRPSRMAASDRDSLLAALHRHCWGDRIASTLTCTGCGNPFDLSFQLTALQSHLNAGEHARCTYYVPVAEDELAA